MNGQDFSWVWTEAEGHSGGTLTGVKNGDTDVLGFDKGSFSSIKARDRKDNVIWEVINVYGPVQNEKKQEFMEELLQKVRGLQCSLIMRGDFNLIRFASEKSSQNIDQSKLDLFNSFISDAGIKEIIRKGSKFTWTNKQDQPVMSALDRVFTSFDWDLHYPWATCETLTRVGSDHNPLLITTQDVGMDRPYVFRFEMAWFTQEDFKEKLLAR